MQQQLYPSHSKNLVQQFVQHLASLISAKRKVHSTKRNTCTVGTTRSCRETVIHTPNPQPSLRRLRTRPLLIPTFSSVVIPPNVPHPIANSLRKRGFPIPPQRTWMFLGIRCDVLAVARIFGVAVHTNPQYVCCLCEGPAIRVLLFQSRRRATDPSSSAVCAPRAPASFRSSCAQEACRSAAINVTPRLLRAVNPEVFSTHPFLSKNHLAKGVSHLCCGGSMFLSSVWRHLGPMPRPRYFSVSTARSCTISSTF